MSEELTQVARAQVDAFNEGDWDALRETMTPDSVYEEPATGRRVEGPDAIVEANQGWKTAFPDATGTVNRAFASDDCVALEITWSGTHDGTLQLSEEAGIRATGKKFSVEACEVLRIEDGKIAEGRHFFDLLGLLDQLGTVSPEALAGAGQD